MRSFLFFLLFFFYAGATFSQAWMQYLPATKSEKELTFYDYQDAFNQWCREKRIDQKGYYYDNGERRKAYGWKQFKRWEIQMQGWYDSETGRFFDIDIWKEYEKNNILNRPVTDNYNGNWTSLAYGEEGYGNDGNGRINCLAFHPTNPNIFWVGTPWGGIWVTEDFGISWTPLSDNIGHIGIGAIAIPFDYDMSHIIYLGTGDRAGYGNKGVGILKSTDGGVTWNHTGLSYNDPTNFYVGRLLILPGNDSVIYAATNEGVYVSSDKAETWDGPMVSLKGADMEFHPANDSILYVSTRETNDVVYIYRSTDRGETWDPVFVEIGVRIELAVSPDEPDWVYAIVSDLEGGLKGFYRSTNKGESFQLQYDDTNILGGNCAGDVPGGQGGFDLCITVHPQDAQNVFIGGINIWESTDAGLTWQIVNDSYWTCGGVNHNVHVDQHWLDYHPSGQSLWVCNDGGIYGSPDNGVSWTNFSGGLVINQPYRISNSQQVYNKIIMGQQDNGTVLWENNTIDFVGGGDGTDCLINPINHQHQIRTQNSPDVAFTTNNWATTHLFQQVNDSTESWFKPYILLPHDTVYYGLTDVWKSTNKGFNFSKVKDLPDVVPLKRIAVAPSNHQVFYFWNKFNFYKTFNDFVNHSPLTSFLPFPADHIYSIEIKNDDPNTLWITNVKWDDGHKVYKSTDGGFTWDDFSEGLPDSPWYDIIQNDLQTAYEEIYVCGYFGVYVKLGEQAWVPFNNGLPNVISFDMDMFYDGSNSKLRIGTHGRGVWETDLFSPEPGMPGIWTGLYSTSWHDNRNWQYQNVPGAVDNVVIPAGCPYYPSIFYDHAACKSITVANDAQLTITGKVLTLSDSLVVSGTLRMSAPNSELEVDGNIRWKYGSAFTATTSLNNKIRVYGDWIVANGAINLSIDSAEVYFMGNNYGTIYNHGTGFGFGNLFILKSTGKSVIIDGQSTRDINIKQNLSVTAGTSLTHNSQRRFKVYGDITANGNLYFQDGTCTLYGDDAMIHLATPVSYFNHLEVDANNGKVKTLTSNILIQGDLDLLSGQLNHDIYDIKLTGDLNKTGGTLTSSTGRFIFRGSDRQAISGNVVFNIMELAKPSDTLFINSVIICHKYDWAEGTIAVTTGDFMALDLIDDGIYGSFYLKSPGSIELTQDAGQSVDLNGKINIESGNFTVNGGSGTSNWPGAVNSELWISNGLLDFKHQGIHLSNSANFLEVITGGVIRTSKSFTSERNDFTPGGGWIELFGGGNADLSHGIGGAFWDVKIFKAGTVSAIQNLTVDNSVDIQVGTLDINGKTVHIENLLDISDKLKMTLPSSQVSVIGDVIWRAGSSADISEGTIAFKGNWYFNNGTNAQLAGNNTVKPTSVTTNQYVYHKDSDACFANFSLEKPFVTIHRHLILDNSSDYPMRVNGNLTLLSNNSLRIDSAEMIVGGNVQANSTSFMRVYETGSLTADNAIIDGVLNLFGGAFTAISATIDYGLVMTGNASADLNNLTLNGTIDIDDGSLIVHNNFTQSAGGHLILDGGSFILDKPYTGNMFGFAGTTDLNGGFFEISYDGIQFGTGATVNFNGGTLRVGGHFRAVNINSFQPSSGTVELINTIGANIEVTNGNYFHRLVINKSGYNPCFPIYPLTVNDQMVLQKGEYYTFNHGLYIGDDLIIESLGKLTAGGAEIQVGGDWVNNRGTAGFVENTSSVWLTPAQTSTISSETFNELVIQASTSPGVFASMAPNSTITVNGDFILSEGALLMNDNCTLNANSVVFIKDGGGLNANPDATGTVINCNGHWWDYNTTRTSMQGFTCGQSTVSFKGAGDQQLIAYGGTFFNHLNLQKPSNALLVYNPVVVSGNLTLQSGSWSNGATGLSHVFFGDFNCLPGASWLDVENEVSFEGVQAQTISNTSGNPLNFGNFRVDRQDFGNRSGQLTIDSDISCTAAIFVGGNISMADHQFDCAGDMIILPDASVEFLNSATIRMTNNKTINVNGGSLFIGGDAENQPLVTHMNTGYYKVYVHSGGQINAAHTTFEYLHTRGIEFAADGGVFGDQPFNYCTLRDGISGGILFYMSSASNITLHNVNFPLNTWGGTYNVAKYENAGNVYMPGAIGGFAGPTFEYDPHNRIHWPSMGTWEGDESTEWHDLHNWRYDYQVPDAATDVIIPAGATYYPNFNQPDTTVNSLRVDAGASLTISGNSLTVLSYTDIGGALVLVNDNSSIFTDSLVWQSGSSASLAAKTTVFISGNMFIRRGSNLNPGSGTFEFYGNDDSDLICHDTAQVHHLYNFKTAPYSLNLVGDTLARLTVNGAFQNGPGATLKCPSSQEWVFNSHLKNTDNGHYRCQNGTIRLAGAMPITYFRPNQGDYFNNLIIETTSSLNLYNTYSDTLRIRGDLTINPSSGTSRLVANNFKIMMWGDWINNLGTTGFIAGTSEVWFWHPSNPQSISGNTVFNELYAHNNPNGLSISGNNTVDDLLVVLYPLHVSGNLTANVVNIDDGPSELHLYDGCYMQAGTLIQGGMVYAHGGTFMVNDLNEDGIFGTYILDNGLVVLGQEEYSTSHDLMGSITINGGELRCTGGGGSSAWPANIGGSYASLTMTGGLFYLQNQWVEIRNNSFTESISGGTIRINHGFYCTAGVTTFTPTGGAVEIVTPDDAGVAIIHPDSHFWDLIINNGDYGGATYPSSNFKVKNELKVLSGKFHIVGFDITVGP
jgi:hypothetical protein